VTRTRARSCKIFRQILLGGLAWAVGNVEADVTPNSLQTMIPMRAWKSGSERMGSKSDSLSTRLR
jgi:hypothetical protein